MASSHHESMEKEKVGVSVDVSDHTVYQEADQKRSRRSWIQWIRRPLKKKTLPIPTEREQSREEGANWFSQVLFLWMNKLMVVGYNRPLQLADMPLLNRKRRTAQITERLVEQFQIRSTRGDKHALLCSLNHVFFWEFWSGGICQLLAVVLLTLSPLMLKYMIIYASDAYYGDLNSAPIQRGVGLAIGVIAMQMLASLCINQFLYRCMSTGGMARASLISMIYGKSQRISNRAKAGGSLEENDLRDNVPPIAQDKQDTNAKQGRSQKKPKNDMQGWSNGTVTNLMSTDTYRIDQAIGWVHIIWTTVIQIIIIIIELIVNIGPSALAGFSLFLIMMPLMSVIVTVLAKRRGRVSKITDKRISLTQEILQGVRFVKYFAWENSFLAQLKELRGQEIRGIQFLLGIRSGVNAVAMSLPIFASILAFVTYSLTHPGLSPANIFSSLSLFNSLRMPLNMLPLVVAQTIDAYVGLGRIQAYLLAEEETEVRKIDTSQKEALRIIDGNFTWETSGKPQEDPQEITKSMLGLDPQPKVHGEKIGGHPLQTEEAYELEKERETRIPFHLDGLNLSFSRDELVAIVGSVGSGKSSLLAALAGDMRMTSGAVTQGASMAYCPQYAWIQNSTVRENIIFGRPFDQEWYDSVIEACALRVDLEMLPQGDQTEVGERGITLSGGQKQRLNIARAIYFDAEIVLLDDPLSAVDAHVGQHIFQQAICGLLGEKCRILATHQLHVLSRCDRIIWLQHGKIEAIGTFSELMTTNQDFVQLLSMTASEKQGESEEKPDDAIGYDTEDEEKIEIAELKKELSRKLTVPSMGPGLMEAEEKAENGIAWSVYYAYVRAAGNILTGPFILLMCCLAQSAQIVGTIWLSYWTSGKFSLKNSTYIAVYVAIGAAQLSLLFAFAFSLTIGGTNASKKLLQKAMQSTLKAPMSFFDTTPLGRIINRFSKDVDTMDNFLTEAIRMYLITLSTILAIFILIMVYFPYFTIALVPLTCVLYFAAAYYRSSARELKRHEAILRSHVFARFSEALSGTATIRAYGVSSQYLEKLNASIDDMDACYFLTFSAQCWLSVRLDIIGNALALVTALLVVTSRLKVNPSTSAVVLSYVLQVVGMIQFMVKQLAEVENSMNSTERIIYYANELPSEGSSEADSSISPASTWPERGEIKFDSVQMRYRDGLPLVLKGLDLHIKAGERIGFVGRTGAGKSSIMSCLFRLVELSSGKIEIDGVDISKVDLHDLRSRMSIIPQDPTLFEGTVRRNLDPFSEYTDLELWQALRSAHLVEDHSAPQTPSMLPEIPGDPIKNSVAKITLETPVLAEGLNFSLGQRQLIALARALVRKSRIIVCDEATSSIDEETDRKIQHTMLDGFKGSTVLCIAHRLRTIVRYDRIVVMDGGRVVEHGEPLELWTTEGGLFRAICDKSKICREDFGYK